MIPIFSWLTKLASYPYKSWVIVIASLVIAAVIAGLILAFRYTRATGIVLRAIGVLLLVYGLLLTYVKFRVHAVKVPSTTWVWIPSIGIAVLLIAWFLRRQQVRRIRDRIKRLANACADRIESLEQERGAPHFVDQMTSDGESVLPLLRSLVRRRKSRRKGWSIVLDGPPGSGKTATLLKFARDCQASRPGHMRPLIAIYVDLAEYAAQTENLSLSSFIQTKFIRGDSSELDAEKAWTESGRDVDWVFLFDNADLADLRQGADNWSSQHVKKFVDRHSRFGSFYVVIATSTPPENTSARVIKLENLTDDGCKELLIRAGIDKYTVDELTRYEGLHWYLRDPGALKLLAPVLAHCTWTTSDNVHEMMRDAIDHALQNLLQSSVTDLSSLRATATATIKYLMQVSPDSIPDTPGEISKGLTSIAETTGSSPQEIGINLTTLAECGIVKRIPGRDHTDYIIFSPAVEAYFYSCALLESPGKVPINALLSNSGWRLTAISLLQIADDEMTNRFLRAAEWLFNEAIDYLNRDELAELAVRINIAKRTKQVEVARQARREWAERMEWARQATNALFALIGGMQNRPELLDGELREKAIDFSRLVMPFCESPIEAYLLEIRYALGTPEKAVSTLEPGLNSQDGNVVLDTASRIVNAINELTELTDVYRSKLINVIIIVGLRSLTVSRERESVPFALRIADGAGVAAIILYLTFFGLGGLLQLTNFWRQPLLQICEILGAALFACPMIAARYNRRWRMFILEHDFQTFMKGASGILGALGATWIIGIVLYDLSTFTMPLMPLVASYILIWPVCVLFYLEWDRHPTIANVIFPLPRIVYMFWRGYIEESHRTNRNNRSNRLP